MLVMGEFVMQIFIRLVTSSMASQEVWAFATGKLGNKSNQIFCLRFDRVYDLHFRIQINFGQISFTQL